MSAARVAACKIAWLLAAVQAAAGPAATVERLEARLDALLDPDVHIDAVVEDIKWAEGPLWDRRSNALLFSDVPANRILRWSAEDGLGFHVERSGYTGNAAFPGREPGSNGLAFDAAGRLVFCQHGDRAIARLERDGTRTVLVDRYAGRRLNSPNDLVISTRGDLYFTDPPFGLPGSFADPGKELDFQGVFRLDTDGRLAVVVTELEAPNGIALSPDESILYVSNASAARPVWFAWDVLADGMLANGRQFAEARAWLSPADGVPDGMKTDADGNLFAAGPGGVHVFAPDGTRLGRIVTGVPTGNLAWGEDGSVLYIAANHRILRVPTRTRAPASQFGR